MKRSQSIRLVQMGAVALTLAACEERVEVGVFETIGQCIAAGNPAAQCETALQAAQEQHQQVAPRYATQQDCEAEFGASQCTPAPAAGAPAEEGAAPQVAQAGFGGGFMPLMAGYMMGRMMSGGGAMTQPLYRPAATAAGAGGAFHTAAGAPVARGAGFATVPRSVAQAPAARSGTIARGGFGARAARFGGGGIS